MAYLLRKPRRNPATGQEETYYQIQHPGRKVYTLGYVTDEEAQEGLLLYRAALVQERHRVEPVASTISALAPPTSVPSAPERTPAPTIREWWGDIADSWPTWPECKMRTWLDARGVRGKALRNWDDSRRRIVTDLGALRLDEVTRPVVDAFIARLRSDRYDGEHTYSDRTVQIRVGHLMGGLKAAVEYGVVDTIPAVKRPRIQVTRERRWATPDQAVKLVQALRRRRLTGRLSSPSYTAILVGLSLGLRMGEIRTRRWTHVDWAHASLEVCPVTLPDGSAWLPKAGRCRTVQIPDTLLAVLREEWLRQGRGAGWIFPSGKKPGWPIGSFKKALEGACSEAGLPQRLHPHALRHTSATALAWQGASLRDLMDHHGWSSEAMARVYLHTDPARLRQLVTAADPLVLGMADPGTPEQGPTPIDLTKRLTTARPGVGSGGAGRVQAKEKPARKAG